MKALLERRALSQGVTRVPLAVALVATLFIAGNSRAAESGAKEFNYDPGSCKTDAHGKLYIGLGRNVLGVPTTGAVVVAHFGNESLKPPDPTDASGCPDNPEQLSGYGFPFDYNDAVGNESGQFPNAHPQVIQLQLIKTEGDRSIPVSDDKQWTMENVELRLARSICSEEGIRGHESEGWVVIHEELPNGFTACRLKHGDLEARSEDMRTTYMAHAEIYRTPLGRPFIVNCSDQLYAMPVGHCDVDYVFAPELAVSYMFQPYRGPRVLPIDQVIAFDRTLRAAIAAALMKNYHWPDQTTKARD